MSFTTTCDADKARIVLELMFKRSLPNWVVTDSPERIYNEFHLFEDEEAVRWLDLILCHEHFISWRIDDEGMYVPTCNL